MTSIWIIRDNINTNAKPLTRNGMDLPEVLVDMADAHNIFGMVWPLWKVNAWGKGGYEVLVSGPAGGVVSLGPVDMTPPDLAEALSAPTAPADPPRLKSAPAPMSQQDTASFRLLLLNMQTPAHPGWTERLKGLSKFIPLIDFAATPGYSLKDLSFDTPGRGCVVHLHPFLHEHDPKLRCYARWLSAYTYLEKTVYDNLTWDAQDMVSVALAMAYHAAELYLRESPKECPGLNSPIPMGSFHQEVLDELDATAGFLALKDADYGQAFRRFGPKGVLVRTYDKFSRYTTLKTQTIPPTYEPLVDSLKDMEGYSLILAGLFQESLEENLP